MAAFVLVDTAIENTEAYERYKALAKPIAEKYGGVCMTEPHEPYAIGPRERDQWLLCMNRALEQLDVEEEVRDMLKDPLYRVADAVRNRAQSTDTLKDPNIIAAS